MVDTEKLFIKADKEWDKGNLKIAFELFLEGAKAGHEPCQDNLGVFYECGLGTPKNSKKALYWYKRAIKTGSATGMSNIANYYFKRGSTDRAKFWYRKAIKAGDGDAALEMAKVYLSARQNKHNKNCAIKYLNLAVNSSINKEITPDSHEKAKSLLDKISGDNNSA